MLDIVIIRPNKSDQIEINSLFDITIRHTFGQEYVEDDFELIGELIADQQELIDLDFATAGAECFFLVAQLGSQIVGTICHRPCSDIIIECAGSKAADMIEVGSVYILPQFQGKGIARQLLNAIKKTLVEKGHDGFWLDSGYTIAKKVWAKVLGEPSIIMKDYWGEGIDHHLWFRRLDEI